MRALVAIALCGCGPSLTTLAEHRHYREAICGAQDGSSDDRDAVGAALQKDAGIAVHVHAVSATELARVLGDGAGPVWKHTRFVRVEAQTNALPIDELTLTAALDDGVTRIAVPIDWDVLSRITGEALPEKHRESTYLTNGNVLRVIAAVATAGLSLPLTDLRPRVVEVEASDDEYRKSAPYAYALRHAMRPRCSGTGPLSGEAIGARCTWFFAMAREMRVPAELALTLRYGAKRVQRDDARPDDGCAVERTARVGLGDAAELDAIADRVFGAKMRAIATLDARAE